MAGRFMKVDSSGCDKFREKGSVILRGRYLYTPHREVQSISNTPHKYREAWGRIPVL